MKKALLLAVAFLYVTQSQARGYDKRQSWVAAQNSNSFDVAESGRRTEEVMGKKVLASVTGVLRQLKNIVHESLQISTQVCRLELTMNITDEQTSVGTPVFSCHYMQRLDPQDQGQDQGEGQGQDDSSDDDQEPDQDVYADEYGGISWDEPAGKPIPNDLEKPDDHPPVLEERYKRYKRPYRGKK